MTPKRFTTLIWSHYTEHGRHSLPWRNTKDPYRILVSEIMLQQTQVDRVIPKYTSFLKRFPSFKALASAPLRDVLLEWKGLGYNRRGLNLKRLAEVVTNEYHGKLPRDKTSLMKLPGIGPYTAGAVSTFVWNTPETFIETNIRTVFIHHFPPKAGKLPQNNIPDSYLVPLIEKTIDAKNPREWYYALMDYGAYLKKTIGNVSRKSSGYTKQSRFEGSKRQLRARVLHTIAENKTITLEQLSKKLSLKEVELVPIVAELAKEHFVIQKAKTIRII